MNERKKRYETQPKTAAAKAKTATSETTAAHKAIARAKLIQRSKLAKARALKVLQKTDQYLIKNGYYRGKRVC